MLGVEKVWPTWLTWRRGFVGVVALGAAVRVIWLAQRWNRELAFNDSFWYSIMATDITDGKWFRTLFADGPTAEHPPLTPILMVPLSFLGDPLVGQRITTTVIGIITVAVVALVGRRLGGDRVGIVAGLLAAVVPNVWLSDGLVMSESVALLFVSLFLLVAVGWARDPSVRTGIIVGLLCGLGALARSELLLLAPLVAIVVLREHGPSKAWRPVGAAAVGCIVALLPWFAFNATRFDRPVLLTTNDGTTLIGANCDQVYSGEFMGSWSFECVVETSDVDGDESVRSAEQRDLAIEYIGDNLDRVPFVVGARVLRAFDLYGVSDMVEVDVGEERPRAAVWVGIVVMWMLLPLAAFGLWRLKGTDRQVLVLPLIVVAVTTVLFYGGHRLRAPAEPVICLAAAITLAGWRPERRTPPNDDRLDDPPNEVVAEQPVPLS